MLVLAFASYFVRPCTIVNAGHQLWTSAFIYLYTNICILSIRTFYGWWLTVLYWTGLTQSLFIRKCPKRSMLFITLSLIIIVFINIIIFNFIIIQIFIICIVTNVIYIIISIIIFTVIVTTFTSIRTCKTINITTTLLVTFLAATSQQF